MGKRSDRKGPERRRIRVVVGQLKTSFSRVLIFQISIDGMMIDPSAAVSWLCVSAVS